MRRIRQWMSDHSEITGIILFLLVVIVVGGAAYGITSLVTKGSGDKPGVSAESEADGESQIAEGTDAVENPGTDVPGAGDAQTEPSSEPPIVSGSEPAIGETINEYGVYFQIVEEQVTAKIETNLRRVPSTEKDEDVVVKIFNGEWVRRTGIGHNGWSRVEYEGQVLYAVTSYLSTDGSTSSVPTYQEVNESVTAKEEVYLRSEPDSSSEANIVTLLPNGTYVTRIGIGSNGWSRLDYNGTTVYAVTSLLTTD